MADPPSQAITHGSRPKMQAGRRRSRLHLLRVSENEGKTASASARELTRATGKLKGETPGRREKRKRKRKSQLSAPAARRHLTSTNYFTVQSVIASNTARTDSEPVSKSAGDFKRKTTTRGTPYVGVRFGPFGTSARRIFAWYGEYREVVRTPALMSVNACECTPVVGVPDF